MVKISFDMPEEPVSNEASSAPLELTTRAAKRILEIMAKKGDDKLSLRISVQGGGCSGFSYSFKLTDDKKPTDLVIKNNEVDGAEVIVDSMSFSYLKGSKIDFEETLEASQFIVDNPNATSSCGCGSSFSI